MKFNTYNTLLCTAILLTSAMATTVAAQTSQEKGFALSKEAKVRDTGWRDMQAAMTMTLKNKQGEEDMRHIRIKSFEVENDGDKSLTVFDQPRDVKGTAFLSFSHALTPDEQWLYLPSLKRVKRISSRNKSGPFMGSEFAFEDMSSFELEKYTYNYLEDAACGLGRCFVVEQIPAEKSSGYTRRVVYIGQEHYRIDHIDFYDRKSTLLKTLTFENYQQYLGQYWRAIDQQMVNHQNGKQTRLTLSDIEFRTGLTEGDFNKNSLKRAR